MDIRETISVAIDALRANKLRAILTSLGVIIGSASIVLVVTVALTSKKFVLSRIESIGNLDHIKDGFGGFHVFRCHLVAQRLRFIRPLH